MIDLDTNFIEKLIKKQEKDDSIRITNMIMVPACEKGENFMSVVLRIKITGKRNINNNIVDFTSSLIVKKPYQSKVMQDAFNSDAIFNNEVIAYNILIPLLKERFKLSLPIADCLHADKRFILLEDLGDKGYDMQRNVVSMDIHQTLAVIQELAVFHGASIILKQTYKEDIEDLSSQIKEVFRLDNLSIVDLIDKNISVILTLLKNAEQSEEIIYTINRLENNRSKIYERVSELFQTKRQTSVFNHGDCWRNNILFKNSSSGIKVRLIDLQMMRYTSVAADLNYFLYINVIPAERIRNFDLYIETYLKTLHRVISEHDIDHQLYNKDWLEKEMEEFSVFGFMCSIWISPAFYYDKKALPDMDKITAEQMDANYQENFILENMTPSLEDRLCSLAVNFVRNYKF